MDRMDWRYFAVEEEFKMAPRAFGCGIDAVIGRNPQHLSELQEKPT